MVWLVKPNRIEYDANALQEMRMVPAVNGSEWAKRLLQADMKRHGVSYADLADKLAQVGIEENERNIRNKINRGSFSAAFMIECYFVMGLPTIRVFDPEIMQLPKLT